MNEQLEYNPTRYFFTTYLIDTQTSIEYDTKVFEYHDLQEAYDIFKHSKNGTKFIVNKHAITLGELAKWASIVDIGNNNTNPWLGWFTFLT